eukprot:scaffold52654_cov75-Phaeocystis_antarctica.AAC.6
MSIAVLDTIAGCSNDCRHSEHLRAEELQPHSLCRAGGRHDLDHSAEYIAPERQPLSHDSAQLHAGVCVLQLARGHVQAERRDDLVPLRLHELHKHRRELAVRVGAENLLGLGLEEVLSPQRLPGGDRQPAQMSRVGGGSDVAPDRQIPREHSSWGAEEPGAGAGGRSRADLSACDSL